MATMAMHTDETMTDVKQQVDTFDAVSRQFDQCLQAIKAEKPGQVPPALLTQGQMLLLELRERNRAMQDVSAAALDNTNSRKIAIDSRNLQLESLQYEREHLQKEIAVCRDFQSQQEPVVLKDIDEFLAAAPPEVAQLQLSNPHKFHLDRLTDELQERKELLNRVKELQAQSVVLEKQIASKKKFDKSLGPTLDKIMADAAPIKEHLLTAAEAQIPPEKARYLPGPLYVLFTTGCSYERFHPESFSVEVDGDVEAAKKLYDINAVEAAALANSAGPSNDRPLKRFRMQEDPTDAGVSNAMSSNGDSKEDPARLQEAHPLIVQFTVKGLGTEDTASMTLFLRFHFIMAQNIVSMHLSESKDYFTSPQAFPKTPSHALIHLYADDTGDELARTSDGQGLPARCGVPFRWVQMLAGLHYPHPRRADFEKPTVSDVVSRIRRRFLNIQAVNQQVQFFVNGKYPWSSGKTPAAGLKQLTFTPKSKMEFSALKEEDFLLAQQRNSNMSIITGVTLNNEKPWWTSGSRYFQVKLKRANDHALVLVQVPAEYPDRPPVFVLPFSEWTMNQEPYPVHENTLVSKTANVEALSMASDSTQTKATFDNDLKDLENKVNFRCAPLAEESRAALLLSVQLHAVAAGIDLIIQQDAIQPGTKFLSHQGKVSERGIRGRDRRKPVTFSESKDMFDQILDAE